MMMMMMNNSSRTSCSLFTLTADALGGGNVKLAWQSSGSLLAACGANRRVHVITRVGRVAEEFALPATGEVTQMAWNRDGEVLAVLQRDHHSVILWHRHSASCSELATNLQHPIVLLWSLVGPQLAIATAQGNVLMYDVRTKRKLPILGKHAKKITCGCWNSHNMLALGSIDKIVTISTAEGETVEQKTMLGVPVNMRFSERKQEGKTTVGQKQSTLSMSLNNRNVCMFDISDADETIELAFQAKYGDLIDYFWYGDGYLLAGFSRGYAVAISTHAKEIGEELHCLKMHDSTLRAMAITIRGNMFATCTSNCVRVVRMTDFQQVHLRGLDAPSFSGSPTVIDWSSDGQILTVGTDNGFIYSFLVTLPSINAACNNKIAFLSSLQEICVVTRGMKCEPALIAVDIEPSFIAVGASHAAVGMNNRARIYRIDDGVLVHDGDYLGTIECFLLNEHWACALSNQCVQLHLIERDEHDSHTHVFPEQQRDAAAVSCVAMTDKYLLYCTDNGVLYQRSLYDECRVVTEYRHEQCITSVWPTLCGTRMLLIDVSHHSFVFNAINSTVLKLPSHRANEHSRNGATTADGNNNDDVIVRALWHPESHNTLLVALTQHNEAIEFVLAPQTLNGACVNYVSSTKLPTRFNALSMEAGKIVGVRRQEVHEVLLMSHDDTLLPLPERITQLISLHRLEQALALTLSSSNASTLAKPVLKRCYISIAERALHLLDVALAARAYRYARHSSSETFTGIHAILMALNRLQYIEENALIAGHIAIIMGEYDCAEQWFLASSQPIHALELRCDLLEWPRALRLAATLAPHRMVSLSIAHARQLEQQKQYEKANTMFTKALHELEAQTGVSESPTQHAACRAGVCRTLLQCGEVPRGVELALSLADNSVLRECAAILERNKMLQDAADMYARCGVVERAVALYIQLQNLRAAEPLLQHISVPKLHGQFAKAKEQLGAFEDAEQAYERADNFEAVIRINLHHLDTSKAFSMVRNTRSVHGAVLVAQYCRANRDFEGVIEFLLLAEHAKEAFEVAQKYDKMHVFLEMIGDDSRAAHIEGIAQYFEERQEYARAAAFHVTTGDYSRAIRLFLMCGVEQLDAAIDVVKKTKGHSEQKTLVRTLSRFLSGETDGQPKDRRYQLRLALATGAFEQAAVIGKAIAHDEQSMGNYKAAHDMLLETSRIMRESGTELPRDMQKKLVLLHSYILVKTMVRNGDHYGAARMLIRVAKNISQFGAHVVPILTSTVIECQRAGLRRSAYEYAAMLMRVEYRNELDVKYKRKIETIVRRRAQEEDEEETSPCPYCLNDIANTLLDCPFCKNDVPFCSVTGCHLTIDNWSQCSMCHSPALFSKFVEQVAANGVCPMCEHPLETESVVREVNPLLKAEFKKTSSVKDWSSKILNDEGFVAHEKLHT